MFNGAHFSWRRNLRALLPHANRRKQPPRRVLLEVEELETRALLSASGVAVAPLPTPTGDVQPLLSVVPEKTASGTSTTIKGFTPTQIQQAYGVNKIALAGGNGAGETIAIVDAYYDPSIIGDANKFSSQAGFNLPAFNTPGGPTLSVVTTGGGSPKGLQQNSGWAGETSLDVEWAHAIAPDANILLVEAPTQNLSDLLGAVKYAAAQPGVVAVSMSWGESEFASESGDDSTFTAPGVTYVAASGDSSAYAGPIYPATSPYVLAVGGTSLQATTTAGATTYKSESAWFDSGGGYATYEGEPSYQSNQSSIGVTDARLTPDVSYDANPSTGFAIYDSVPFDGAKAGWIEVGGTSAGAPQWAAIVALADQARSLKGGSSLDTNQVQSTLYNTLQNPTQYASSFHDITRGSNGYAAGRGYDLATGLGSPIINNIVPLLANVNASSIPSLGIMGSGTGGFASSSSGFGFFASATPGGGLFTTTGSPSIPASSAAATAPSVNVAGASSVSIALSAPVNLPISSPVSANSNVLASFSVAGQGTPGMLVNNSVNPTGSSNAPAAQAGTTFGASGWRGASDSLRLSSLGMHGPTVDQLASDLAGSLFEIRQSASDSDSGGDEAPVFDMTPPAVLDAPADEGGSEDGGEGGDGE